MTVHHDVICLGGGVTGLAVGRDRAIPVFESRRVPGGICASYYVDPEHQKPSMQRPEDGRGFRFEIGGGHWIFGDDQAVTPLLQNLVDMRSYRRRASIFLDSGHPLIPYPLQFHLSYLGEPIASKALSEIEAGLEHDHETMADWVHDRFGETLTGLFFGPFNELYTAGLWSSIAPQDGYKNPFNIDEVRRGAVGPSRAAGYNVSFLYPREGLNILCARLAASCDIRYEHEVTGIDVEDRVVYFSNGGRVHYNKLISTLPLGKMSELVRIEETPGRDPCTSVLVLNIGAIRGPRLPGDHWVYFAHSKSGFHRVGVYSNVDAEFLPAHVRGKGTHCALYVERAYVTDRCPGDSELRAYAEAVIDELQTLEYIEDIEVCDPSWIPVAYTWNPPGSDWPALMQRALRKWNIIMAGRYGRWQFQGITDSIAEGLKLGDWAMSSDA